MADDPRYVRLASHRARAVLADVRGSGWKISGTDVAKFPKSDAARRFVRSNLKRGVLEPASKAEFEEVQEANEASTQAAYEQQRAELGQARVEKAEGEREAPSAVSVQQLTDDAESDDEDTEEDEESEESELDDLGVKELKALLKEKGLPVSGNRDDLVERLQSAQ